MAAEGNVAATIGIGQWLSARKQLRELEEAGGRPKYEIPEEAKSILTTAQQMALEGLPDEQKQMYIENILRTQQQGISQLSERKGGVAGVANLAQSATEGYRNLLAMDAQQRMQNIQQLQGARQNMADYKDLQFQTNELQPYQQSYDYARALQGAGMQNIMTGAEQQNQAHANRTELWASVIGMGA